MRVRARVQGDYRTLDATPTRIEFVIDAQPPEILDATRSEDRFELQVRDAVATDAEVTRPLREAHHAPHVHLIRQRDSRVSQLRRALDQVLG